MNRQRQLADLEALLDELLRGIQDVLQSGEVLSDEFQGMLAQELSQTTDRIDQLRQEIGQEQPAQEAQAQPATSAANAQAPSGTAQLLWILAGQNDQVFIQYLHTYPDAETNALLRNPAQLQSTIEFLNSMMPPGQQPSQDGIPHSDINSSNIYGFRYDPKSKRLLVRFQSGSVYGYQGVPQNVFNVFQQGAIPAKTNGQNQYGRWWTGKQPSLGAAFYNLIRQGGYEYQRLS